jgi:hypothetical protein
MGAGMAMQQNDRWAAATEPDAKAYRFGDVEPLDVEPVEQDGYMIE